MQTEWSFTDLFTDAEPLNFENGRAPPNNKRKEYHAGVSPVRLPISGSAPGIRKCQKVRALSVKMWTEREQGTDCPNDSNLGGDFQKRHKILSMALYGNLKFLWLKGFLETGRTWRRNKIMKEREWTPDFWTFSLAETSSCRHYDSHVL